MSPHVITNQVLVLALDNLYRGAMQNHERVELRELAQHVTDRLGIPPADVPVEGYYADDSQLSTYFRLMRALQESDRSLRSVVADMPAFKRLEQVTSSSLFGTIRADAAVLLPRTVDVLAFALEQTAPDWTLERVVACAQALARGSEETTLVAIAAITGDPVTLTAIRETVVLYAGMGLGAALIPEPEDFIWRVDQEVTRRATVFIETFNHLFEDELPAATPQNAEIFWNAFEDIRISGRCVCIGRNPDQAMIYYHWAIHEPATDTLAVHEFWAADIWTTTRFRRLLDHNGRLRSLPN